MVFLDLARVALCLTQEKSAVVPKEDIEEVWNNVVELRMGRGDEDMAKAYSLAIKWKQLNQVEGAVFLDELGLLYHSFLFSLSFI